MNKQKLMVAGGVAMAAGLSSASAQQGSPLFKIGNIDVRPHAAYSVIYDDNIFLEHKSKNSGTAGKPGRDHDFIHSVTPGIKLEAGDVGARQSAYVSANYDVVFSRFSKNSGADAIDHNASVMLGGKWNRLSLDVNQSLASRSDADAANLAASGRVKRKTWGTKVGADYEVSEKTGFSLDLAQTIGDFSAPLVDTVDRSATLWLDHQVLPKVKVGVGGGAGYLQVDGSAVNHNPNSAYYSGQVRLDWKATEKLSINASGGIEFRNIQERGASDPVGMIFSAGASWRAAEKTTLSLSASRGRKSSNALGAQQNEETSLTAGLSHSLWDRVSAGLDGGISHSHYEATTSGATGFIRDEIYFYVKPSLSYKFIERAQATVFYQYRRNDANLGLNANDFYDTQVGLEVSYRF